LAMQADHIDGARSGRMKLFPPMRGKKAVKDRGEKKGRGKKKSVPGGESVYFDEDYYLIDHLKKRE